MEKKEKIIDENRRLFEKRKNSEKNPGKEDHKNLLPGFAN